MSCLLKYDGKVFTTEEDLNRYIAGNQKVSREGKLYSLNDEGLEFGIPVLAAVTNFLDSVGVDIRLVPQILSGSMVIESAIAAANFVEGTVDIIDDLEKRPSAWNKLPEEAAHWWYRLLNTNSELKKQLLDSDLTLERAQELSRTEYDNLYPGHLSEEAIGQLIAEAIKRIENNQATKADLSFFQKFVEWLNEMIYRFKTSVKDPFEAAAIKILTSDVSDLLSWEEYQRLSRMMYIGHTAGESIVPLDYSLITHIGKVIEEMDDHYGDSRFYWKSKEGDHKNSPYFDTRDELERWIFLNVPEYEKGLDQKLQEIQFTKDAIDKIIDKQYKKRTRFLKKTIEGAYDLIDQRMRTQSLKSFEAVNASSIGIESLTDTQQKLLSGDNDYFTIVPSLRAFSKLLEKYSKIPISLSDPIKVDGATKQERNLMDKVRALIKEENPNLRSISAEDFVSEVHNWLGTNYLLGFAKEKNFLSYRVDQTFTHVSDRVTFDDVRELNDAELLGATLTERQRLAHILGLTKKDPVVRHNKISIRFNNKYHTKKGHFNYGPSAFGSLTYFYTGKNKYKDAVLIHEIQNDNIEHLVKSSSEKGSGLDDLLRKYKEELRNTIADNINNLKLGGYSIYKRRELLQDTELNDILLSLRSYPHLRGMEYFKEKIEEKLNLTHDNSESIYEHLEKIQSERRTLLNFMRNGGLKSILDKEDLETIKKALPIVENVMDYDDAFMGTSNGARRNFRREVFEVNKKIEKKLSELYLNPPTIKIDQILNTKTGKYSNSVDQILVVAEKKALVKLNKDIDMTKTSYFGALRRKNKINKFKLLTHINLAQFSRLMSNIKYNEKLYDEAISADASSKYAVNYNIYDPLLSAEFYDVIESLPEGVKRSDKVIGTQEFGYDSVYEDNKYHYLALDEGFARIESDKIEDALKASNTIQGKVDNQYALRDRYLERAEKAAGAAEIGRAANIADVLERELNYFAPLVHQMLQEHIRNYGKGFPMYFSGAAVTKLTQGNTRTSWIYAGKEEVKYTEREAKEIKKRAAINLKLSTEHGPITESTPADLAIKALSEYRRKGQNEAADVFDAINDLSNGQPIETGAIYNAMTRIPGIKLIWQESIPGLRGEPGGYLVDLSNYHLEVPVLFALEQKAESKELSESEIDDKVKEMLESKELEIDCAGKIKASQGLSTSFTKGGQWKIIKDLKGYPTHKKGGVDIVIGKEGVSIARGYSRFTAERGLVMPKKK